MATFLFRLVNIHTIKKIFFFNFFLLTGIGNSVPGWRFNHLKPEISSGADFFQQSLEIAKARSNLRGPFQDQNDENKDLGCLAQGRFSQILDFYCFYCFLKVFYCFFMVFILS